MGSQEGGLATSKFIWRLIVSALVLGGVYVRGGMCWVVKMEFVHRPAYLQLEDFLAQWARCGKSGVTSWCTASNNICLCVLLRYFLEKTMLFSNYCITRFYSSSVHHSCFHAPPLAVMPWQRIKTHGPCDCGHISHPINRYHVLYLLRGTVTWYLSVYDESLWQNAIHFWSLVNSRISQ